MKKIILAGLMAILPFGSAVAATDYYIKLGGVEGEASRSRYLVLPRQRRKKQASTLL